LSTVFLGTSEFAAAILQRLAASDAHRPALVLTRPDRPRGRGQKLASPPVAERARALGIALEQPENVNDPQTGALIAQAGRSATDLPAAPRRRKGAPSQARAAPASPPPAGARAGDGGGQAVVVCAFGALISEPLLSEYELLNVHPSLLPRWRGAAPIERAIMAGDSKTGVSIMRITAGLDSGPVFLAGSEPIQPGDTYGLLAPRLAELAGELLLRVLDLKARGRLPAPVKQDERSVTYAEKIDSKDRLLDPVRPAADLERVVRALQPHIGARVALSDGTFLGVHSARVVVPAAVNPGRATGALEDIGRADRPQRGFGLTVLDGRLLLNCAPGVLELLEVQPPGGRVMQAAAFLRGHGLSTDRPSAR
jgi:methionyl-tRNA formyltransferase